jgi:chitin disaccharide deacetylase
VKRLIITADDFGAAREVNEAVESAHRGGVLTGASLMIGAPAAADAVARARRMPGLRVGLHVVLVEGRPVLPPSAVNHLVDDSGMLRSDTAAFGAFLAVSRAARRQLSDEITAQFESFRSTGLHLDHCNAHQHFHLHPAVGSLIVSIGARFGLRALRVPLEPIQVLRRIEQRVPVGSGWLTAPFARLLRRRCRLDGLLVPDQVFGLHWSGQMNRGRLAGLIRNLPDGLSEIYLHPATGPFAGSAPGYRYRHELDALTAAEVVAACRDPVLRLGGFSDFLGVQDAPIAGLSQGTMGAGRLAP